MNFGTRSFKVDRDIPKPNMRLLIRPSASKGSTRYFTLPLLPVDQIQEDALFTESLKTSAHNRNGSMSSIPNIETDKVSEMSIEEGEITPFNPPVEMEITSEDLYHLTTPPLPSVKPLTINVEPLNLISQIEEIDNEILKLESPIPEFKTKQYLAAQMTSELTGYNHPLLSIFESSYHILNKQEQHFALSILKKELDKSVLEKNPLVEDMIVDAPIVNDAPLINKIDPMVDIAQSPIKSPTIDIVDTSAIYNKSMDQFVIAYLNKKHVLEQQSKQSATLTYFENAKKYTPRAIDLPDIEASGPKLQNTTTDVEFQEILQKIEIISKWDDPENLRKSTATLSSQLPSITVSEVSLVKQHLLVDIPATSNFTDFVSFYKSCNFRRSSHNSHNGYIINDPHLQHKANIYRILHSHPNITSKFVQAYQEHHKDFSAIAKSLNITRNQVVSLYYYLKYKYPVLRRKIIDKPRIQIKWTENEKQIAYNAFELHGKDFKKIMAIINKDNTTPKSEQHVRTFFYNSRRRLMLEKEKGDKESNKSTTASPVIEPVLEEALINEITAPAQSQPTKSSSYWTSMEKLRVQQGVQIYGPNFEEISIFMNYSKSAIQIKNYYNNNINGNQSPPLQAKESSNTSSREKKHHNVNKASSASVKHLLELEEQRLSSNIHEIKKRSPDELLRTQFDYANANLLRRASLQQRFQGPPKERLPELQLLSQLRQTMLTHNTQQQVVQQPVQQTAPTMGFSTSSGQLPSFDTLERKVTTPPLQHAAPPSTLEQYIHGKMMMEHVEKQREQEEEEIIDMEMDDVVVDKEEAPNK